MSTRIKKVPRVPCQPLPSLSLAADEREGKGTQSEIARRAPSEHSVAEAVGGVGKREAGPPAEGHERDESPKNGEARQHRLPIAHCDGRFCPCAPGRPTTKPCSTWQARSSSPLSSCFCSRSSCNAVEQISVILEASPCLVIRLAEQSHRSALLVTTGLVVQRRPPSSPSPDWHTMSVASRGCRRQGRSFVWTAGAGTDVVGTEDDLFGGAPGQDRSESLQHGAAREHLGVAPGRRRRTPGCRPAAE